ncbi:uncharacterized protein KNAG_0B03890 [Huiozyma naganishii CBS 8797]|uniref:Integrase catalytic domain-containing protein n=1 Tax=Huiozyma naganishii (strain ATCC MYA-139 / BCRC 22969 / CBS 8797 / KCTC 17520 / NBRC 10181 / NCYC 3082 / Yp74L-3) TaxID=1071383 RepID=J7R1Z3_HUIN7|nr:hypothetical protein KNAG_0B03890 [Kazachstania naganishii CBS 8797]CCK68830.1 hypothetical protein KNAG_0B03890 [Kazachstania naganishii CBS 8797]
MIGTVRNQFEVNVLAFQVNRGSEFTNNALRDYLSEEGNHTYYTSVADHQSNGVAERLNLTLLNDCRTLLKTTKLPYHLWFHAVQFATLQRNSVYNDSIRASARAKAGLPGIDVKTIPTFGQPAIAHFTKIHNKLRYRGEQGFALTPSSASYDYIIYLQSKGTVIDTTHYAVIRLSVKIDPNEEYDNSIFNSIITKLTDASANTDYYKFDHVIDRPDAATELTEVPNTPQPSSDNEQPLKVIDLSPASPDIDPNTGSSLPVYALYRRAT